MRVLRRAATAPSSSPLTCSPLTWLFGLAGLGSAASATFPEALQVPAFCGALGSVPLADAAILLDPQWSAGAAMAAWAMMVVAMMPPLLAQPVTHVWTASLPERRPQALLLFSTGYMLVWLAAGLPLIAAGTALRLAGPPGAVLAAVVPVALLWNASPWCQVGRNRCHRIRRIGAFGRGADADCMAYGLKTGSACAVVCWPWMLAAICIHDGHPFAMAAAGVLLFLDRLAPAAVPTWRVPPVLSRAGRALRPPQKVLGRP